MLRKTTNDTTRTLTKPTINLEQDLQSLKIVQYTHNQAQDFASFVNTRLTQSAFKATTFGAANPNLFKGLLIFSGVESKREEKIFPEIQWPALQVKTRLG
jgi:hypothetical protein